MMLSATSRPNRAFATRRRMTTEDVTFEAPTRGPTRGYLSQPPGDRPAPGLIVVHEWWGLNDDVRSICDRFAQQGFVALAVDLYGGKSTADAAEAMQLVNDMKTEDAMKVVEGGIRHLVSLPRCRKSKVGVVGFCLGGAMSIAAACTVPGLSAAVPFYGIPKQQFLDFSLPVPPIQGHFGRRDGSIAVEKIEMVASVAQSMGHRFELCLYDAGHAFMRASDPKAYDAAAAELAWTRAVSFLHAELR